MTSRLLVTCATQRQNVLKPSIMLVGILSRSASFNMHFFAVHVWGYVPVKWNGTNWLQQSGGLTDCQIKLKGAPTQFARGQLSCNFVDNLCHSTNEVDMPYPGEYRPHSCLAPCLRVTFNLSNLTVALPVKRPTHIWPSRQSHSLHFTWLKTLNMNPFPRLPPPPFNYLIESQASKIGTKSKPDSYSDSDCAANS